MTTTIRSAFSDWPRYNAAIRDRVATLTEEQLAIQPAPDRWPLWATIGHLACQRVSGFCGQLGEPGAESTPFPNALYECPGDEDLEHVYSAAQLAAALDSTFAIIDGTLDRVTLEQMDEVVVRQFGDEEWRGIRGSVIQRSFAHDISHATEINEILSREGLPLIDLWP